LQNQLFFAKQSSRLDDKGLADMVMAGNMFDRLTHFGTLKNLP
jgi:hypothetical protein